MGLLLRASLETAQHFHHPDAVLPPRPGDGLAAELEVVRVNVDLASTPGPISIVISPLQKLLSLIHI